MSLFESSITGNILNDGQTTETSGITAGQLATVLTAYTPLTDTATNTASIGTNSAAVAALQTQVAGMPAPPDLAPYALVADLAAAEGSIAANQSSITALNSSLTTGLAGKANQSALDALQLEVDGKSTPASVDVKLANHPTTAAMSSAIASADNAALASVAATYGLKTVTDQLTIDVAARQTAADVDQKIATALLAYTDSTGLNATVALRTTPADVDQKIATALLTYVQQVVLDAALAIRDGRLDAAEAAVATLQAAGYQTSAQVSSAIATALVGYATTGDLANYATSVDLTAAETSLQSAIDSILAQLAILSSGGGNNLINAQAWPGEITWDLLVGTNTLRNLHVTAPLSANLQNDSFTVSLACDSYSKAESDANLTAALVPYYTGAQTDGAITAALVPYYTSAQTDSAIAAALLGYYTNAQTDGAIAAALVLYYTSTQTDSAIAAALVAYYTSAQTDGAIAAALVPYSTTSQMDAAITAALVPYYTSTQTDSAIAAAVAGIDLSPYYTAAQTDAAIAAALVPVSLGNAPAWAGNATWQLLKGSNVIRNLHLSGPLVASLQNNTDTLQIDCQAYSTAQTYTQAEVNTQISNAVDALNLSQYTTQAEVDSSISSALVVYWDQGEVSAEIASQISAAGFLTEAQGDARYHPVNGNAGGNGIIPLVLDNFTPRMIRALLPRAPLSANLILGNAATIELECDCYSKTESDGRYVATNDLSALDSRYFPVNGNTSGGQIIPLVLDAFTPRIIRSLLPRSPLSANLILGNAGTIELDCDCYSKAESDAKYALIGTAPADPLLVNNVRANGADYLTLRGGSLGIEFEASNGAAVADLSASLFSIKSGVDVLTKGRIFADSSLGVATAGSFQGGTVEPLLPRVTDQADNSLCTFATAEVHTVATRLRVDDQLYIDDVAGTATGLITNAISTRAQDTQLTITGGSSVTVVNGDLDIQGTVTGTSVELNTELRAPTVRARPSDTFLTIRGGTTGMYLDGAVFTASTIQADPGLVSSPAWLTFVGGTTGIEQVCTLAQVRQNVVGDVELKVLNEDATTGEATIRVQNGSGANGSLRALESGSEVQLQATSQTISLQNQTGAFQAPVVVQTNGLLVANYGLQNNSDSSIKANQQPTPLADLKTVFDAVEVKSYTRTDTPQPEDRIGFIAQEILASGTLGPKLASMQENGRYGLDYSRLTCVLWGVCKQLEQRIAILEDD